MKLYDSRLAKKIDITDECITIYNCGPTVYNYVHIGNIRPLITMDVLYRYLIATNKNVKYALNITDVDDKIINKAKEENKSEKKISKFYTKAYFSLFKQLNILKQNYNPLVTKNINGIIGYVKKLVDTNKGYVGSDGDVYFSIDSVKNTYGCISKQNIDQLLHEVRKESKTDKKNPLDFVLWKKTTEGLNWKSPWNDHGRPGWHTECAYFINKIFGDEGVSIHSGGTDLKFPHHENEEAQNMALFNKPLAKCWMHCGHINIDNVKMSKSLNNFILAKDIISKYDANAIRWFFLQTKYENPINYSQSMMETAASDYSKIIRTLNNAIINLKLNGVKFKQSKVKFSGEFISAMDDDINFPNVITHIHSIVKSTTQLLKEKKTNIVISNINTAIIELSCLGFSVKVIKQTMPELKQWKKFHDSKDYQSIEKIRLSLASKGLI
ncbi:MAG: cysteine--tRNA ligase [Mycoplasmoidaceae bacterium]|nr:MAG: cysteine--tRNA ligase [Mycoplasmoidaceae bacterium]